MSNGSQGQSTLQNVYSYSFTANNLFQVSLVKDNDPNRPGYKRQFFCFLTLAPGQQAQGGGRTYNFTNKINMKQDVHNIIALAHAFRAVARGQKQAIGNFSLFTDSSKSSHGQGGSIKQVFLNEYIKQSKNQNPKNQNMQASERFVSLGFRIGNNQPVGLMFSVPDALACADVLEFIGKLGLNLDAKASAVSFVSKAPKQEYSSQEKTSGSTGQQNTPPLPNSPDDVANNFQDSLHNAAGGPASPPPMGGPGDDIPF